MNLADTKKKFGVSNMVYFTPEVFCRSKGFDDFKEKNKAIALWKTAQQDYEKDIIPYLPIRANVFFEQMKHLCNCDFDVISVGSSCVNSCIYDKVVLRISPENGTSYLVTFVAELVLSLEVIPPQLCRKFNKNKPCILYSEFNYTSVVPGETLDFTFFCSNGIEHCFKNVVDIVWDEECKIKKGRESKKLFTAVYFIKNEQHFRQIRSKNWSTVWFDFLSMEFSCNKVFLNKRNCLVPCHQSIKNVYIGELIVDGENVVVTFVNTKRGKPPISRSYKDNDYYCK